MKRRILSAIQAGVGQKLREWQLEIRIRAAERAVAAFKRGKSRRHNLPRDLIVSLTSYPPRFGTLAKTLKSLLSQTLSPDRVVLWIATEDADLLPSNVLELTESGLEIRTCRDLGSYKKIVPALEAWPDAYIVTADDDLYYKRNWLATLVGGLLPDEQVIVCRRAHRPRREGYNYAPYLSWDWDVVGRGEICGDLFPTSGAGAVYPPGSPAPEVLDEAKFMALCPTADDIWLYWMARRAGSKFKQVGGGFAQVPWMGSQECSLISQNLQGRNDEQLRAVMAVYPHE